MGIGQIGLEWMFVGVTLPMMILAFFVGRHRAQTQSAHSGLALSSAANFFGYFPALVVLGICAVIFALTGIFGEMILRQILGSELPASFASLDASQRMQYLNRVAGSATSSFQLNSDDTMFNAVRARYLVLSTQTKLGATGVALALGLLGFWLTLRTTGPSTRVRDRVEKIFELGLWACAAVAVLTTLGIIFSLLADSWRFFGKYPIWDFLFGTEWNAQTQAASTFGAVPLFFGTMVIAIIAMCVALPVGIFSAVFLSEYASATTRSWVKPTLEILAGIPTVVYGFFAILVISPVVQFGAENINALIYALGGIEDFLSGASKNALSAGFVMGIMIVPFVSSLSDDVIRAVPDTIRDGALALGATKSESISQVVLPAAFPGIIAATLLAISRAIGETMIVVMAAGQSAQITPDLTAEITTVTVQIVASMTLDAEFDSAVALSAFALGLVLFIFTLIFNLISFYVVNRYRKRYA